jgi:uncharacterized protein YciI
MQFLVIAYDHKFGGFERRMAVRKQHLALISELTRSKRCLYAARLESDNGQPIGSAMVFDFPDREQLDVMLATEPYTKNDVWERVEVVRCVVADQFKNGV